MSFRGGRGGGRGGRAGPGDGLNLAGMTYAEISGGGGKESEELYPEYSSASSLPFPVLPAPSFQEKSAVSTQTRFGWALSQSTEWLKQGKKGDDLDRYTDKYKPPSAKLTSLQAENYPEEKDFAPQLYQSYFHPNVKPKVSSSKNAPKRKKLGVDDVVGADDGDEEEEEKSDGGLGSGEEDEDYDADEGDDDYADQHFDNGEDEGDGDDGGGDDGGEATFD
ncbi:hypothetical protein BDY24DRAFT_386480 [Mrakia frigida]|uniref:uncharacterized protein n=1 Tax=Mrakia frigida TaxID=29902 RepID=UPI003FCC072F